MIFPDASPSFCCGFEAGCVWQRLVEQEARFDVTVHTVNQGFMHMMAREQGYIVDVKALDADEVWANAQFRWVGRCEVDSASAEA